MRISIILASLIVLNACSVGPDFKRPQTIAPTSFTRDAQLGVANNNAVSEVDLQWWKAYQSEKINQLVELALKNNPNIVSA